MFQDFFPFSMFCLLKYYSNLQQAQIGRANAYSHRARVLERNAALQIHVEKSVARTDLEEIYETYEKAADEFRVCYEVFETLLHLTLCWENIIPSDKLTL